MSFLCFYGFFSFLLTVYVSPVFYGPLWTDFSINGWMDTKFEHFGIIRF